MSDLDFFLIFISYLLSFMTQYLICKNDSLKHRLYILEKENKDMEHKLYIFEKENIDIEYRRNIKL